MQIKTIEKNVIAKMEKWLATIIDETLRKDVKNNLLVSGGCITSMLLNEPVNDYDVYLMDIDVVKRITQYYTKDISGVVIFDGREKESLIKLYNEENGNGAFEIRRNSYTISLNNLKPDQIKMYFEGAKGGIKVNENIDAEALNFTPLYLSPNAISLSDNLQIVIRFWGTAQQIHKTFDFIHATNFFTFNNGLERNLSAVESILTKRLYYQGSLYPVTSIIRAKKFIKKGWNISAGELLKIMFQISAIDLSNADVLEEQLIGVDVAFFDLLVTALRNKMESDKNFKVSTEYFNALIDKIFNEGEE